MHFSDNYVIIGGEKVDKMTNGFLKIPEGEEANVQLNLKWHFEDLFFSEFGKKGKAKVTITPIDEVVKNPSDRLYFTHAYKVRIKG